MPPLSTIKKRSEIDRDTACHVIAKWLAGALLTTADIAFINHLRHLNMVDQLASAPVVTA